MRLVIYTHKETPPAYTGKDIFHSVGFFQLLKEVPGVEPYMVMAYDGERPIARLVVVVKRVFRWFPPTLFYWCTSYGNGEYFDESHPQDEVFAALLKQVVHAMQWRCFIIEFRNIEKPLFGYKHFRENGFFPVNSLRIYNSLHSKRPVDVISKRYKRSIQTALESGATAQIAESQEDIQATLKLIKNNYRSKIERYFPDPSFFHLLLTLNGEREYSKIFCVKYQKKIIGGAVCVFSSDRAYLIFSSGLRKSYPKQHPGILAVWEAIGYADKQGYPHFEFLDAGIPFQRRIGHLRFYSNYGGKQASTRRWFRFSWRWLNIFFKKIYV